MMAMHSAIDVALMLDAYLARVAADAGAFSWQARNCAHFAGGWVREATGRDCLSGLADVADARAARRVLARMGVGTLAGAVSQRMGWPGRAAALAQVGDVVLLAGPATPSALGAALGLCAGRTVRMLGEDGRLASVELSRCTLSWPLWGRAVDDLAVAA